MRLFSFFAKAVIVSCIIFMFGFIAYGHLKLKQDFYGHWHYIPPLKTRIDLTIPKFSDKVPYHLTPKPKWEDKVTFWSYSYTCYGR